MSEKQIEQKLVKSVKSAGGIAPKFVSPGMVGMPDRLVLFPNGIIAFVEVKDVGKKPRAIQAKRIKKLRDFGFKVFVLDNENNVEEVINEIQSV